MQVDDIVEVPGSAPFGECSQLFTELFGDRTTDHAPEAAGRCSGARSVAASGLGQDFATGHVGTAVSDPTLGRRIATSVVSAFKCFRVRVILASREVSGGGLAHLGQIFDIWFLA